MAWIKPGYSKRHVNRAGEFIANDIGALVSELEENEKIVNNWRASHIFPLNVFRQILRGKANFIEGHKKSIVAQRIKRYESIEQKLIRIPSMQLASMDDIGGCRAIIGQVSNVEKLVRMCAESFGDHELHKTKDLIQEPAPSGYRGVHQIFRFRNKKHCDYDGLRIELQFRSFMQHSWATCVEVIDSFTGQKLKSGIGEPDWLRFFALMSSAIAIREDRPIVPDTPMDKAMLSDEIIFLESKLNVLQKLDSYSTSIDFTSNQLATQGEYYYFVVILDTDKKRLTITGFKKSESMKAYEFYRSIELSSNSSINAVLVSSTSIEDLKTAYPNYYVDTSRFTQEIRFIKQGLLTSQ